MSTTKTTFVPSFVPEPDGLPAYQMQRIERLRQSFINGEAYVDSEGAVRWYSNDSVLFDDTFREAFVRCPNPAAQGRERAKQVTEQMAAYRRANKGRKRTAEEMFEMRAAFGPGETVVDVITGDRFQT